MKTTLVSHSVEVNGAYMGLGQAMPVFKGQPVEGVDGLELNRYIAETVKDPKNPTADRTWVCEGYDLGEQAIDAAAKVAVSKVAKLELAHPAGKYTIRPDLKGHTIGVPSDACFNEVGLCEADYSGLRALHAHRFLTQRHLNRGKCIVPTWATTPKTKGGDHCFRRFSPFTKQEVELEYLPIPISYRPLEDDDMRALLSWPDFDDVDLEVMRNRMAAHFYDMLEGRPLYVTWFTPDDMLHLWESQKELLTAQEFYDPAGNLPPLLEMVGYSVEDYLAADLEMLTIADPVTASDSAIPV